MKKMLAVLLSVLMAFTLVTVNVAADTYNKGRSGFWWNKLNTKKVEDAKEEDVEELDVEEATEKLNEEVDAEDVEEIVGETNPEPEPAEHDWEFASDGPTITATDKSTGDSVSFSILAPEDLTYSGSAKKIGYDNFSNVGGFAEQTSVDSEELSVKYYKGVSLLEGAPVNAGNYRVEVECRGAVARLSFEIEKRPVTPLDFDSIATTATYTGEPIKGLSIPLPEGVSYYNGILIDGIYVNEAVNVGEYKGCVYLSDSSNYVWDDEKNPTGYRTYKWSIVKASVSYKELVKYVEDQDLTYNGTLQQPELLDGVRFATLGNIPFVTKYDCIAIDQGGYDAVVVADSNHELIGIPGEKQVKVPSLFGKDQVGASVHWKIARRPITEIRVKNATKEYGDIDPKFDVELEGLAPTIEKIDEIAVKALLIRNDDNSRMEQRKNWSVGTYEDEIRVVVNKDEDGKQKSYTNYEISEEVENNQTPGTLTITKAPLTFYLNVTQRDYSYTPIVLVRGLKNAEKLVENVDYEVERYDEGNEPKVFKPGDYTTTSSGTKCVKIHLKDTIKANNYDTGRYVEEDGKKVWEHLDYVVLKYQISEPTPKVTPKVPTAKEAKAVVIRTVTSIIRNLSTKRFGR